MRKILIILTVFSAVLIVMSGTASADHRHYNGCGHSGYYGHSGHNRGYNYNRGYGYRAPVYADYWHDHWNGGRNVRCHFRGGRHNFSGGYGYGYRPGYVAVQPYWHDHWTRGRSYRCHFYDGRHNYGSYHRPRSSFNFGISIFR